VDSLSTRLEQLKEKVGQQSEAAQKALQRRMDRLEKEKEALEDQLGALKKQSQEKRQKAFQKMDESVEGLQEKLQETFNKLQAEDSPPVQFTTEEGRKAVERRVKVRVDTVIGRITRLKKDIVEVSAGTKGTLEKERQRIKSLQDSLSTEIGRISDTTAVAAEEITRQADEQIDSLSVALDRLEKQVKEAKK
jgi:HPt (histidine-containing phosphotransfer) domain-containing protein